MKDLNTWKKEIFDKNPELKKFYEVSKFKNEFPVLLYKKRVLFPTNEAMAHKIGISTNSLNAILSFDERRIDKLTIAELEKICLFLNQSLVLTKI